ncbi:GNAT family N-acetyltransferase [Spirosoma fluviale]|uniref:Acetyltransferase (GNAT) domain-containing protein n=1 Tax=Spirosoma fluviale TaxID=1597977 RepID=A0A286GB06_9BACT|nr:GNAT family N-acetyltransferase [Spirosoma fluviale]SOD92329.1 Acetyltransferase (GNAT) domain-containing protein [Spirosoma fluviale]
MISTGPTDYTFLVQINPQQPDIASFCQPGFFFNEYAHLRQQNNGPFYLISAVNRFTQEAEARCAFFLNASDALSPIAAPFGSIELSETLPTSVLNAFVSVLLETAHKLGCNRIRLVNYPRCYAPQQTDRLLSVLAEHEFVVVESNVSSFLPVNNKPLENNLIPAARRRLRKCREAGFVFAHRQAPNVPEVVRFIQNTRQQLGYPLTLEPDQLINLLQEFPKQFSVFTVTNGPSLAAVVITVRVRYDILYTFLPASDPACHNFSPMIFLIDGLCSYCQQQEVQLLDLGVSLDARRQPKPGLLRFKRNLGAQESPKYTLERSIDRDDFTELQDGPLKTLFIR